MSGHKVRILADYCSDLPREYYEEREVTMIGLSYEMEGAIYYDGDVNTDIHHFYQQLRDGVVAKTSMANAETCEQFLRPFAQTGEPVIYLAFSSALSGTYECAASVADQLNQQIPGSNIVVVDSKCASMGEGLLLHYCLNLRDEGKSQQEIVQWLQVNRDRLQHWFTVDSLQHLHRGGRVSRMTAVVGTILSIKPVLWVGPKGELASAFKAKGRKKSLIALVDMMERLVEDPDGQTIFISHGDCLEDAQFTADLVKQRFPGIKDLKINYVGPVIGAHSGPGTVALFFLGKTKREGDPIPKC